MYKDGRAWYTIYLRGLYAEISGARDRYRAGGDKEARRRAVQTSRSLLTIHRNLFFFFWFFFHPNDLQVLHNDNMLSSGSPPPVPSPSLLPARCTLTVVVVVVVTVHRRNNTIKDATTGGFLLRAAYRPTIMDDAQKRPETAAAATSCPQPKTRICALHTHARTVYTRNNNNNNTLRQYNTPIFIKHGVMRVQRSYNI